MIDPKELRIGNWVYDTYTITNEKTPVRILSLHEFDGRNSINASSANDYYPIPLSPEVLKACGLPENHEDGIFNYKMAVSGVNVIFRSGIYQREIYYLHQLQNLHFDLKGTELTYNPNQP